MYEKTFSNIKSVVIGGVLLILLLWGAITSIRLYTSQKHIQRLEQRLESVRVELESAQNRERELTETVGNIRDATERTDKILSESTTTIQSVREKIQVLEEYFNNVNLYLSANCNHDNNNSNSEE